MEIIDPDEESARAIPVIEERVRRKAAKAYAARVNLLVYVNFWAPSDIRRTVQALAERIEPWRESFTATWLLWGDEVFRC